MDKVLVIGASGQIGSELTLFLRKRYGGSNVIAGWHVNPLLLEVYESGPYEPVDCCRIEMIAEAVKKHKIKTIYHLAALLSARGEESPLFAWEVNVQGLINTLEVARRCGCSVFVPSSIGAFGSTTPLDYTPQDTLQRPETIYGVSKVSGELLCDYYFRKYGVDTRGTRFPGIISHMTLPGGGTTDYAVDIFYHAVRGKNYVCYLKKGTYLDMMYMPDAVNAAVSLMESDPSNLIHRNAFNVTAMSFDPEEIAAAIRHYVPDFEMSYKIDPLRQAIADSWPNRMDDSAARNEWGWSPRYDLKAMSEEMIQILREKQQALRKNDAVKSVCQEGI